MDLVAEGLKQVLSSYQLAFQEKVYGDENNDDDLLMNIFGITPELKRENKQYWGRELGMCWQRLIIDLFSKTVSDFGPALRIGSDEPCDLITGKYAIDTKYRIGSGDSGLHKKFKAYGPMLKEQGYEPVFLILREDNLPAAITACLTGGWTVLTNQQSFDFIKELTNFDLQDYLHQKAQSMPLDR